jgi:hypothetical protein
MPSTPRLASPRLASSVIYIRPLALFLYLYADKHGMYHTRHRTASTFFPRTIMAVHLYIDDVDHKLDSL